MKVKKVDPGGRTRPWRPTPLGFDADFNLDVDQKYSLLLGANGERKSKTYSIFSQKLNGIKEKTTCVAPNFCHHSKTKESCKSFCLL